MVGLRVCVGAVSLASTTSGTSPCVRRVRACMRASAECMRACHTQVLATLARQCTWRVLNKEPRMEFVPFTRLAGGGPVRLQLSGPAL